MLQVTFYIVLSAWDFGFVDVYYPLLLHTRLRERDKLWGCKGESMALLIEQVWSKRWVVSWLIGKIVC